MEICMGTCKHMKTVENIAKDINRQYSIQLDYEYIERIKRLICGSVCNGVCDPKNILPIPPIQSHRWRRAYVYYRIYPGKSGEGKRTPGKYG